MLDPRARHRRHRRLGPEGDAEAGLLQHGEVVGAVTDRQRLPGAKPQRVAQGLEHGALAGAAEDRSAQGAGEPSPGDLQRVGVVVVGAEPVGDVGGEHGEAARRDGDGGAVRPHGPHQGEGAGHQGEAIGDPRSHRHVETAQQRHALQQGGLESEFAAHGSRGDVRHGRAQADGVGEFIDAFLLDQGGIHVGDEEALAPAAGRLHHDVDGRVAAPPAPPLWPAGVVAARRGRAPPRGRGAPPRGAGGGGGPEARLASRAGRLVELLPALQHLALGIAGRSMFSLEMARHGSALRHFLFRYARGLAQPGALDLLLPERIASPTDRRRAAFRRDWTAFIERLIAEREAASRPEGSVRDLFDLLAGARDPQTGAGFDRALLRDEVATMMLAGHETTAVTLFWSCFLLARFPAWQEELAAEAAGVDLSPDAAAAAGPGLPKLRSHLDEALRLYPPAFLITREAREADQVGGFPVPPGATITISPFVIHRHERFWRDPDRFDPARFAKNPPARHTYIPFGAGPRICVGASFAITEALVVLGRLLQRFRLELGPGAGNVLPRGVVTTQPDRPVRFFLRLR